MILVKNRQFSPPPCILRPRYMVPLGIVHRCWESKITRMMGQPVQTKCLTISSAVWIQSTNVTDRWTDTGPQQRPRLCIVLHSKNGVVRLLCIYQSINQSFYLLIKMYEIHKYNATSKTEQDSKAHWGSNSCP